jgi:hypothetical protein
MKSATIMCFVVLVFLHGCRAPHESAEFRSLVGVLLITGSEPFTDLSLQTESSRMYAIRKDTTAFYDNLRKLQGRKVQVWYRRTIPSLETSAIIIERYELVKDR